MQTLTTARRTEPPGLDLELGERGGDPADAISESAAFERRMVQLIRADSVRVPPYPAIAERVRQLVARDDYGLDDVSRLVSGDPSLAADTLRSANSALLARGTPVASVKVAVARVGAQEVLRLALASALGGMARAAGPLVALRRRAWIDSLAAAAVCAELARLRGLDRDEAFVGGLLHDVGKLVAATALEDAASSVGAGPHPFAFWDAITERLHGELGLVSATRWRLPPALADAISTHHGASFDGAAAPALVALVADADRVVSAWRRRGRVTGLELAGACGLGAAQARAAETAVERIASFVASFDFGGGEADLGASSLVLPERRALPPVTSGTSLLARTGGREHALTAMAAAGDALLATGPAPLDEQALLEVEVAGAGEPFAVWCCVTDRWREDAGRCAALLQPLGLTAVGATRWRAVFGPAAGQGAGV